MASVTPKKAISLFCKECVCGNNEEIRNCTADGVTSAHKCPLFDFRPFKSATAKIAGKSTAKVARGQKVMTPEHKAKMAAGKAAAKAAKLAAGLPVSTRTPKAPKVVLNTKKAVEAAKRMTPEHKLKMKAGKMASKLGITREEAMVKLTGNVTLTPVKAAKTAKKAKVTKVTGKK
jgi:hypothetical protein